MNKAWVYGGQLDGEALRSLIEAFTELTILSWDLARLDFPPGIELRRAGSAFNRNLEVRWEATSDARFRVLILSDTELTNLPQEIKLLEGIWQQQETEICLVDLDDKRFAPQFSAYPRGGRSGTKLPCRVFSRNGVTVFVSPREAQDAQKS